MGCSDSSEDKMYLAKLSRLEIQVKKQKELEKLAKIEGKSIEDMNYSSLSKPSNTEPNSLTKGTKTTKDTTITIKKKKRNNSEYKVKKIKKTKKTKDAPAKKKKRAKSENKKKKKKKQ